jgi:hypothetical protein
MTPLDPVETVLNVAEGHAWVKEVGENRGQAVEAILAHVGLLPGQPWCAAFVSYIGWLVMRRGWPLPLAGGCAMLADRARGLGMLTEIPAPGSIFLVWGVTLNRFRHCGFLIERTPAGWRTVEGNTNVDGSPEGTGVFVRERSFSALDRFVNWTGAV